MGAKNLLLKSAYRADKRRIQSKRKQVAKVPQVDEPTGLEV